MREEGGRLVVKRRIKDRSQSVDSYEEVKSEGKSPHGLAKSSSFYDYSKDIEEEKQDSKVIFLESVRIYNAETGHYVRGRVNASINIQ